MCVYLLPWLIASFLVPVFIISSLFLSFVSVSVFGCSCLLSTAFTILRLLLSFVCFYIWSTSFFPYFPLSLCLLLCSVWLWESWNYSTAVSGLELWGGRPKSRMLDHQENSWSHGTLTGESFQNASSLAPRPGPTQRPTISSTRSSYQIISKLETQSCPLADMLPKSIPSSQTHQNTSLGVALPSKGDKIKLHPPEHSATVPSVRKPAQDTDPSPPTEGRLHTIRGTTTWILQKGYPKYSKSNKIKRQKTMQQMK